jgi:hypothetical protein
MVSILGASGQLIEIVHRILITIAFVIIRSPADIEGNGLIRPVELMTELYIGIVHIKAAGFAVGVLPIIVLTGLSLLSTVYEFEEPCGVVVWNWIFGRKINELVLSKRDSILKPTR